VTTMNKQHKKIQQIVALLIVLLMVLVPIAAFAMDGGGDGETSGTESGSSGGSGDSSGGTSDTGGSSSSGGSADLGTGSNSDGGSGSDGGDTGGATSTGTTSTGGGSESTSGGTGSDVGSDSTVGFGEEGADGGEGTETGGGEEGAGSGEVNDKTDSNENDEFSLVANSGGTGGTDDGSGNGLNKLENDSGYGLLTGESTDNEGTETIVGSNTGNTYSIVVETDTADGYLYGIVGLKELAQFTVTLTEIGGSQIGSAQISLPDGFSLQGGFVDLVFGSLDSKDMSGYKSEWSYNADPLTNVINLYASEGFALIYGQYVQVKFAAESPAEIKDEDQWNSDKYIGLYKFGVQAWTDADRSVKNYRYGERVLDDDGNVTGYLTGDALEVADIYSQTKVWVLDEADPEYENHSFKVERNDANSVTGVSITYDGIVGVRELTDNDLLEFALSFTFVGKGAAFGSGNNKVNNIEVVVPKSLLPINLVNSNNWQIVGNNSAGSENDLVVKWVGGTLVNNVVDLVFTRGPLLNSDYTFLVSAWYSWSTGQNHIRNDWQYDGSNTANLTKFPSLPVINQPTNSPGSGEINEPGSGGQGGGGGTGPGDDNDTTTPPDDEGGTAVLPAFTFAPFDAPAAPAPPAPPAPAPLLLAAAPTVETVVVAPEPTNTQPAPVSEEFAPEEPQVEPLETSLPWWPLLLLIPALLWLLLARLVLVRVPDKDGEYETVARKLARRKDRRWYVDIEKELDKHLQKYGEVMVDFRGGLIKEADKSIYSGDNLLSSGDVRYALVSRTRLITWVEKLNEKLSKTAE
jgi:hypothetical protein